ncbi:hypothetical protein D3C84_788920 [compost metagenome]
MVEHPWIGLERRKRGGNLRRAATADHHRAGPAQVFLAFLVARDQAQVIDFAVDQLRLHAQHFFTVNGLGGEMIGGPAQVVVVLQAARIEGAEVDEVDQALLLVQVVDETVGAGRVAQRHQVLEEGNLQFALGRQGVAVPAIVVLLVDEQGIEGVTVGFGKFFQSDGQGQVGRAEANADQVVDFSGGMGLAHGCGSLGGQVGAPGKGAPDPAQVHR